MAAVLRLQLPPLQRRDRQSRRNQGQSLPAAARGHCDEKSDLPANPMANPLPNALGSSVAPPTAGYRLMRLVPPVRLCARFGEQSVHRPATFMSTDQRHRTGASHRDVVRSRMHNVACAVHPCSAAAASWCGWT